MTTRSVADAWHILSHRRAWGWFATWMAIGAITSFGVISLLTIGFPLLVISGGVTAWLLIRRPGSQAGISGLLSGACAAPAFLSWANRDGPGDVCHSTATETSCQQEWSPIPFGLIAVLLLVGGVVLFLIERRRTYAH